MGDSLDKIAEELGEVQESEREPENGKRGREGEEFDPDDYLRSKDDYDGGW